MKLYALTIEGFRGVERAHVRFGDHTVLVGPNGSGKSTIIDALSLVFGRRALVRDLSEHDFYGSCPEATSRIRIVATLGDFSGNDPERHQGWFRVGRAVPKWWNPASDTVEAEQTDSASHLCAQLGFAARFDLEELRVEQTRYFHDDDAMQDPFQEDLLQRVPTSLLHELGYYVLPTRRTWEGAASFASELFRKAVVTLGGIPSQSILEERDRLRQPTAPLEVEDRLHPLVDGINEQLERLRAGAPPRFQLRVTATDSESLLSSLVPHYQIEGSVSLPVSRHGTGLLSLQTLLLLLAIGRARREEDRSFLLAMEEPELHLPPGLQRRLVAEAVSLSSQTISTTHSPRVASFFPATQVQVLENTDGHLELRPLLSAPLDNTATNAARKLYLDHRNRVVEALMHPRVLVPEGRSEYEWLRLLAAGSENIDNMPSSQPSLAPPFASVVGVIPTHDSAVQETYERLRAVRSGVFALIDGDQAGLKHLEDLKSTSDPPELVMAWPESWCLEDIIGWILEAPGAAVLGDLQQRLHHAHFTNIESLVSLLKEGQGPGRLKTNYLAYEEIASSIYSFPECRQRAQALLDSVTLASLGRYSEAPHFTIDEPLTNGSCSVLRFIP